MSVRVRGARVRGVRVRGVKVRVMSVSMSVTMEATEEKKADAELRARTPWGKSFKILVVLNMHDKVKSCRPRICSAGNGRAHGDILHHVDGRQNRWQADQGGYHREAAHGMQLKETSLWREEWLVRSPSKCNVNHDAL